MQTILGLVAAGLGVALVPHCMSKLHRADVRYLALDSRGLRRRDRGAMAGGQRGAGARGTYCRTAPLPVRGDPAAPDENDPLDGRRLAAA